jgi:hypothetical protein
MDDADRSLSRRPGDVRLPIASEEGKASAKQDQSGQSSDAQVPARVSTELPKLLDDHCEFPSFGAAAFCLSE